MSDSNHAVFLSYASQDAEPVRVIAEALRASGVEVWFDQNELVGGDAWDAKIRRQIKECALFVPVISANTQARLEGYFRLEWKLAAQRTHTMAEEKIFLLPIVIDATRDAEATAPAEFKSVQWTRIRLLDSGGQARGLARNDDGQTRPFNHGPGGEVRADTDLAGFCGRVKQLLARDPGLTGDRPGAVAGGRAEAAQRVRLGQKGIRSRWLAGAAAGVGLGVALLVWFQRTERAVRPLAGVAAAESVARQNELQRGIQLIEALNSSAEDHRLAEDLAKGVLAQRPNDPDATIAMARISNSIINRGFDLSEERYAQARRFCERALQLAPDDAEALHALGFNLLFRNADAGRALDLIRRAIAARPDRSRYHLSLVTVLQQSDRAEAERELARAIARFPGDALLRYRLVLLHQAAGRLEPYEQALDDTLAVGPVGSALLSKALLALTRRGDPAEARRWLDRLPPNFQSNDRAIYVRYLHALSSGQWDEGLRVLRSFPGNWIRDFRSLPKRLFIGDLLALQGKPDLARMEYEAALEEIAREKNRDPNADLTSTETWTLARLGRNAEVAVRARIMMEALPRPFQVAAPGVAWLSPVAMLLFGGDRAGALMLMREAATHPWSCELLRGVFQHDPRLKEWRNDPEVVALLQPKITPAEKSVAVLAFANLSEDKANEYFSDGISEELINVLGRVPDLTVKGWTSALLFKGKNVPIADIARQLGVAYVVRGSVAKIGNRVRVAAQLSRAATDEVVWSTPPLDRELKDVFALQDEIVAHIARALALKLTGGTRAAGSVNPEAHRLYLEGRHFWSQRTEEGFDRAERAFTEAIRLDPTFARAHAGLADLWAIRAWYYGEEGVGDVGALLAQAEAAARQALALDPGLLEVHATFGAIRLVAGRLDEAQQELEKCVALAPNYATARNWRGEVLLQKGRIDQALGDFLAAAQIDPLSPIMVNDCVRILIAVGRPAAALAYAERVAAFGESTSGAIYRARALAGLGRCSDAVAVIRGLVPRLETTDGFRRRSGLAVHVLRTCGQPAEAASLAANLLRPIPADSFVRAFIFAALGRFDEALPLLAHMPPMTWRLVFWESAFDPVRDDPRFNDVMAKVGCAAEYRVARESFQRLRQQAEAKR